jgi:hypothetical protein
LAALQAGSLSVRRKLQTIERTAHDFCLVSSKKRLRLLDSKLSLKSIENPI